MPPLRRRRRDEFSGASSSGPQARFNSSEPPFRFDALSHQLQQQSRQNHSQQNWQDFESSRWPNQHHQPPGAASHHGRQLQQQYQQNFDSSSSSHQHQQHPQKLQQPNWHQQTPQAFLHQQQQQQQPDWHQQTPQAILQQQQQPDWHQQQQYHYQQNSNSSFSSHQQQHPHGSLYNASQQLQQQGRHQQPPLYSLHQQQHDLNQWKQYQQDFDSSQWPPQHQHHLQATLCHAQYGSTKAGPSGSKQPLECTEDVQPKRVKISKCINFISVWEFIAEHPVVEEFVFEVGSSSQEFGVGSIDPPGIVDKTEIGGNLADGFVQELTAVHLVGKSWGGDFDESNLLVSEKDPLCVLINKEATEDASDENIYKDFMQLESKFLSRYIDVDVDNNRIRMPPYLQDFKDRIEKIKTTEAEREEIFAGKITEEQHQFAKETNLWVLRNHPFLVDSTKWRGVIEGYYTFYKDLACNENRLHIISDMCYPAPICLLWHINTVPNDSFLSLVYWKGNEENRIIDFRGMTEEEMEEYSNFPYTSEDGYFAVYQRHFLVHGGENAREANNRVSFSIKELELILAYYFEKFLPEFLGRIFVNDARHKLLKEIITRYANRKSFSWSEGNT